MNATGKVYNRDRSCRECDRIVTANGLCKSHYHREYRARRREAGNPIPNAPHSARQRKRPIPPQPCEIPHCEVETTIYSGLCASHNRRAREWGMTPEEVLSAFSDGTCAICAGEGTSLDHAHGLDCEPTHKSRKGCMRCFRGLLCGTCNAALGLFRDSPDILDNARTYLVTQAPGSFLGT